jgi:hypothetical protein
MGHYPGSPITLIKRLAYDDGELNGKLAIGP